MSRLIDVDELKEAINSLTDYGCGGHYDGARQMQEDCLNLIDEQPTVDVVEVVRCKDCEGERKGGAK